MPKPALVAFKELQTALVSEPIVAYPRKDRPYALIVDASTGSQDTPGGFGAILCQQDPKNRYHVIAYASRGLAKHEKNYTPFLAEMMAAVWGMKHFDVYLRGKRFKLFTDHKPLEKLGKVHTKTLNRLQEAQNEYDFEIIYKKGQEMPADFLSRYVCELEIFRDDLPQLQQQDPFCSAVRKFIKNKLLPGDRTQASLVDQFAQTCFIEKDILWKRIIRHDLPPRTVLVVPKILRQEIIEMAHGGLTGHDGIFKTKERLMESYFWPNMDKDIAVHLQTCEKCQITQKDSRVQPHLLTPLPICSAPNQRVHCDLFGPLQTSGRGKKYILCMTDAFTKYAEMTAVENKEAITVSEAIFSKWICRYGTPLEIVTDGGKEFCNQISKELYKILKVEHSITTPYHPQCNAQAEVANKTIQKYLSKVVDKSTLDWELYLPPLAFSYNTSLHRAIKATPFFLTFGLDARMPNFPGPDLQPQYGEDPASEHIQRLQLCRQIASEELLKYTQQSEDVHNRNCAPHNYQKGQLVYLDIRNFLGKNRKLAPQWEGPYPITRVFENGVVDIFKNNRNLRVNVNRLKPYLRKDQDQVKKVFLENGKIK
ncbi:RNase H-like domain-containing protein, partial [Aeromonas sobria]|uniref:RNase H-like domain-containing protein n=1 Tax=Aeromonas sobria TaxID=646 RepID=UPI003F2CB3F9